MTPTEPAPAWRGRYDALRSALLEQYRAIPAGQTVRLAKRTSNLFRPRAAARAPGLDVAAFDGVLEVDAVNRTAEVLGMTTYEHLVDATLPHGLMPLCVPQLRTITLGGAVTGLGIESASFRNGTPHESVLEMDVLTGAGEILTVTGARRRPASRPLPRLPELVRLARLRAAAADRARADPAVRTPAACALHHARPGSPRRCGRSPRGGEFEGRRVDFLDGTVFSADRAVPDHRHDGRRRCRPASSRATTRAWRIYYRSIPARTVDVLTIHDYLWRWDTDWFWCSRAFGAQNSAIRRLWPKSRLRSDVYWRLVALDRRLALSGRAARLLGRPAREPVVQDIEVPVDRLADFLDFFHREVGIEPIWVCPLQQRDPLARWPLYEFDPGTLYVNVGFWSTVPLPDGVDPGEGRVNRRIEEVVTGLDGRKSLYSTAFYDRESFWSIYGGSEYERLKGLYDPDRRLEGPVREGCREAVERRRGTTWVR